MRSLTLLLLVLPLFAQPPQEAPPKQGGGMRMEPKNLKLLKPEDLMPTMRSYTVALGVKCDYCHMKGDFASDENHKKVVARGMIEMTQTINSHFRGERARVTCYTCHRGAEEPATAPPSAPAPGQ